MLVWPVFQAYFMHEIYILCGQMASSDAMEILLQSLYICKPMYMAYGKMLGYIGPTVLWYPNSP